MGIQYSFRRYEKKYFLSPRQQEQLLQRIAPYMKEDAFGLYEHAPQMKAADVSDCRRRLGALGRLLAEL